MKELGILRNHGWNASKTLENKSINPKTKTNSRVIKTKKQHLKMRTHEKNKRKNHRHNQRGNTKPINNSEKCFKGNIRVKTAQDNTHIINKIYSHKNKYNPILIIITKS
jgi:hypothetical protein